MLVIHNFAYDFAYVRRSSSFPVASVLVSNEDSHSDKSWSARDVYQLSQY